MKKLLLLMAFMLSLGFASYAEQYTFTTSGLTNAGAVSELKSADGNITVTFEQNTGSNPPAYYTSGDCIRMYANNSFTVTGNADVTITSISYVWVKKGSSWTKITTSDNTLAVVNNQAKYVTTTKDNGVRSITVDYTISSSAKTPAGLSFPQDSYTATLGQEFKSPELTNDNKLNVTYTSSDANVATVDENGIVTIKGAGLTTITAKSEETDDYKAGEASYKLTVIDPNALDATFNFKSEVSGTSFTSGIVKAEFDKAEGGTAPTWLATGTAMRLYAKNTLTISVPQGYYLTAIEFTTDTSNSTFIDGTTVSSGALNGLNWTADADKKDNSVVITNGGTKGHIRIQTITVHYAQTTTGIADIEAEEDGVVEYYNLQGVRVAEPTNGLYIRRCGKKVEKVVIR